MSKAPILAVQLNAIETQMVTDAVKASKSMRSLAGEVGVSYVKRMGHKIWDAQTPFYDHFSNAMTAVILKADPQYSNPRVLVQYARESAKDWYTAEGDPALKAARDAAETAKLEVKSHDAMVAAREAQAKREDITVSEQKLAKLALTQAKAERTVAKATAASLAGQYTLAYEQKFPRKVVVMSKQDKIDAFVKAVKSIKATFENLEDGSIDRVVGEVTKAYLSRMAHWTEAK
jgi:hypothetical protein